MLFWAPVVPVNCILQHEAELEEKQLKLELEQKQGEEWKEWLKARSWVSLDLREPMVDDYCEYLEDRIASLLQRKKNKKERESKRKKRSAGLLDIELGEEIEEIKNEIKEMTKKLSFQVKYEWDVQDFFHGHWYVRIAKMERKLCLTSNLYDPAAKLLRLLDQELEKMHSEEPSCPLTWAALEEIEHYQREVSRVRHQRQWFLIETWATENDVDSDILLGRLSKSFHTPGNLKVAPSGSSIWELLNHMNFSPEKIIELVRSQTPLRKCWCKERLGIVFGSGECREQQNIKFYPEYEDAAVECGNSAPLQDGPTSVLPMMIAGHYEAIVYDTGAAANFMSWEKVQELGLSQSLETQMKRSYILGNKKQVMSMGTVTAPVSFAVGGDAEKRIVCHFNVLKMLAVPILMGEPFLRITETLSKYRNRLVQLSRCVIESTRRQVFAIGSTQNEVVCVIDGKEVLALADTGSEVSLMKRSYADKLGISYQPSTIELEFADGSIERTAGFANLSVSLGGKFRGKVRSLKTIVHIFENLVCDFLIDKTLVEKLNVFRLGANRVCSAVKKICSGYLCTIKKLGRLEKWLCSCKRHGSTPTLEEEIRSLENEDNRLMQQEHWRLESEKSTNEQQEKNRRRTFEMERAGRLHKLNRIRQLLRSPITAASVISCDVTSRSSY